VIFAVLYVSLAVNLCINCSFLHLSQAARYRQHCVNGERPSQWEMAKFDPSQNRNPWADCNKIPHNWLRPREDPLNQIWYKSIHWGASGHMGEIERFCDFFI